MPGAIPIEPLLALLVVALTFAWWMDRRRQ
jgi:hypothetical protein